MLRLDLRTFFLLAPALLLGGLSACSDNNNGGGDGAPGDTIALTASKRVITFTRAAPATVQTDVAITGLDASEALIGLDVRPSDRLLYAVGRAGTIYTLDAATGVATPGAVLSVTLEGEAFGVDFNPVVDRLRIVSDTGQNLRVNVDTGAAIVDTALAVNGAAAAGITAVAYTNSFDAACRTTLYYIDTGSGALFTTSAPNDGGITSLVGFSNEMRPSSPMSGFEIETDADGSNTAFAALSSASGLMLTQVDLATGDISDVGLIDPAALAGETLIGLAIGPPLVPPAQAVGDVLGLTVGNRIVSFNPAAPAKLCTAAAITGVPDDENVLGIDVRPSNGKVYALTQGGALMTIDAATGAGSAPIALVADPNDASPTPNNAPFSGLDGSTLGIDFDPAADRLRVVSDTGQNLDINSENGRVITDGTLLAPRSGEARTGVTAVAYTNSIAGGDAATLRTTLFYLDSGTDELLSSDAIPRAFSVRGALEAVGDLDADIGVVNGFDIDGRNNLALFAANVGAETGSSLRTVDLKTGAVSESLGIVGGGEALRGLSFSVAPAATVFAVTDAGTLISFAPNSPGTASTIGPLLFAFFGLSGSAPGGLRLAGMDFRPATGELTGLTRDGRVYRIDPSNAHASSFFGDLRADPDDDSPTPNNDPFTALDGSAFGVDFDPVVDRLRVVSNTAQNLRVNGGATISDGALSYGAAGARAAAYTNNFAGATTTQLYVIDSESNHVFLQDPPNDGVLKDRGPVGFAFDTVTSFEIVGADTAFAAFEFGGFTHLWRIDLGAFAATRGTHIGVIGSAGRTIKALSARPAPVAPANPTLFALTMIDGKDVLVSLVSSAPQALSTIGTVTGLVAGDVLVGMDFRPATGALIAVAQTGRLYTLNTATGAATVLSTLIPAPLALDPTPDFADLSGTSFGVDFNPTVDRLRLVSNTGQNLRINVDTGATITDPNLNRPAPAAAAAYTNSFAGATTTRLYVLDPNSPGLSIVSPPNDGTLLPVNGLGLNLANTTALGFDIAGGANGFALAALVAEGQTQSNLYRINLVTGQATRVGPIGAAGAIVEAMAVRVR